MSEHYTDGRRWSYISHAWILTDSWNDREEIARLQANCADLEAKLRQVEGKQGGEVLFMQLCSRLIGHITSADVKCDPPTDIELRLVSIIRERDQAREALRSVLSLCRDKSFPGTMDMRLDEIEQHVCKALREGGRDE